MKKATALFTTSVATLSLIGAAFVPTTAAWAAERSTTVSTTAEKPSKLAIPHRASGELVSVDQNAKAFTLRTAKGKELQFTAQGDAAMRLADLKAGDHVKVSYKNSHGHMIASKLATSSQVARVK